MSEIAFRTATELVAAIRRKQISSLELLDHYLERVERLNPKINAVVTLDAERARERAKEADAALARGEEVGPLHGLPMTIKDAIETEGVRTTSGASELSSHVPIKDADAVARLKAAGAIVFGKTNLPMYAADCQSYNDVFGVTNNPWDVARGPGGSSGGAAAALAAGLTGLELGSDIGGSIRNPAHFCGVYGHKPTYGIVPTRGHIPGPPGTLAEADVGVIGPMGRGADDLDLGLDVLAGPDDERATAWSLRLPPRRANSLADYRIAAWLDDPTCPVDTEVVDVLAGAVEALRAAGANVDDNARPAIALTDAAHAFERMVIAVTSAGYPDEMFDSIVTMTEGQPPSGTDAETIRLARVVVQRHREWIRWDETRARQRAAWADFFGDHDILLCPVTCTAAFPHDHSFPFSRSLTVNGVARPYWEANTWWAGFVGVAYLPATVAPVGRTRSGLPVGVQVVGAYLEDRTTIDVARRITQVIGGFASPAGF